MKRVWEFYDQAKIEKEFKTLPLEDRKSMARAMGHYAEGHSVGFVHKVYSDGVEMLKDNSKRAGRCLFFTRANEGGVQNLTILSFYKKESDDAPDHIIEAAKKRRTTFLKGKNNEPKPADDFNPTPPETGE